MTVKEWLKRAYHKDMELESLRAEQASAYAALIYRTAPTNDKVQSNNQWTEENKRIKYLSYGEKIDECIAEAFEIRREITSFIGQLSDIRHRIILRSHYILHETIEQTAEFMKYTERHTHRLHKEALQAAERLYTRNDKAC